MTDGAWQTRARHSYDVVAEAYARQVGPLADADVEMAGLFDELVARAHDGSAAQPVIVDVGCGPGWWAHRIAALGGRVVGVDVSSVMAAIAGRGGAGRDGSQQRRAGFVAGSATTLPLADGTCDGVALWYVLHHLTDSEVRCAVREARRVCRTGGVVLVGGHVGEGERIKREGYGLPMEVLVAKRLPTWWENALRAAGFDVAEHSISDDAAHHVLWATAR